MDVTNYKDIVQLLEKSLDGKNAHLKPFNAFDGITPESAVAKPDNSPYTIWQVLCHIDFWQEWFIELIRTGKRRPVLHAADTWLPRDSAPENSDELADKIKKILQSIDEAKEILFRADEYELCKMKDNYETGFQVIGAMAAHLSYHIGQIMLLRRMVSNYPPPSGGDTW